MVSPDWAPFASHVALPPDARPLLDGSVQGVDLALGHAAPVFARVLGIYMPAQSDRADPVQAGLAADRRAAVLRFLAAQCEACTLARTHGTPYELFILGDFNAALRPDDRVGARTPVDDAWHAFVAAHALISLDPAMQQRAPTWRSAGSLAGWLNRIDDILCPSASKAAAAPAAFLAADDSTFPPASDHRPISVSVPLASLGAALPPPTAAVAPPLRRTIRLPIKPEHLRAASSRATTTCTPHVHTVASLVASLCDSDALTAAQSAQLTDAVVALHESVYEVFSSSCACMPATDHARRPRRARCFLPRVLARVHTTHMRLACAARVAAGVAHRLAGVRLPTPPAPAPAAMPPAPSPSSAAAPWAVDPAVCTRLPEELRPTPAESAFPAPPAAWLSRLAASDRLHRAKARALERAHYDKRQGDGRAFMSKLRGSNRRRYNKLLLQHAGHVPTQLHCIRSADGTPVLERDALLREVFTQYSAITSPPQQPVPPPSPSPPPEGAAPPPPLAPPPPPVDPPAAPLPPWADPATGFRPIRLRRAPPGSPLLLAPLLDRACYDRCLARAANRKAAGPDGLPIEALKHMPAEYHDCLFAVFTLQARTRTTLACWKESHSVLLHKRGDATLLPNWRPIGLLNAAGKLWTLMLEDALLRFCETAGLLSDSQCGFRPDRSCLQQLLYVTSIIEDARHFDKNLYVTYIDFANAFGSVGHAQLAYVMAEMGLPEDAIEIVRELYAGACTRVSVPAGLTDPIPITRGTVQGDPLSPLLFILFLEPLIQWLEVDAAEDGYTPGCFAHPANAGAGARAAECWRTERTSERAAPSSSPSPGQQHASAQAEYADDAALVSGSLAGKARMLRKTDLYSDWANMASNAKKSAFTGFEPHPPPGGAPLKQRAAEQLRLGGLPLPFYSRDDAYKYLGAMLPVSLSAARHTQYLLDECEARLQLVASANTYRAHLRGDIESLVLSKITYSAPLGLISAAGAKELDVMLQGAIKHAARLPASTSGECISFPPEALGLGFPSMAMLITYGFWEAVTVALASQGRLGRLSRALICALVHDAGGSVTLLDPARLARPDLWLRRLATLSRADLLPQELVDLLASPAVVGLAPPARDAHLSALTTLLRPPVLRALGLRPVPALPTLLRRLYHLGITSLAPIYDVVRGEFISPAVFQRFYPTATRLHCNSFRKLVGLFTQGGPEDRRTALAPLLRAAIAAHAANPALTALAFPRHPPPPATAASAPTGPSGGALLHAPRPSSCVAAPLPPCVPPLPSSLDPPLPLPTALPPASHAAAFLHDPAAPPATWRVLTIRQAALADPPRPAAALLEGPPPARCRYWAGLTPAVRQLPAVQAHVALHFPAVAPLGHALPPPEHTQAQRTAVIHSSRPLDPHTDISPACPDRMFLHGGVCHVYDDIGVLAGRISPDRLRFLWGRYCQCAPSIPNVGFHAELVALLSRYQEARYMDAGGKVELSNHWAVPPPVYDALRALCSTQTELFASPLNCSMTSTPYCTAYWADAIFGASYDAYAARWSGACAFNPEYTREALARSVHWALASLAQASPTEPFLAVGIMPVWNDTYPHTIALQQAAPFVHTLATVAQGYFNFVPALHSPYGGRCGPGRFADFPVQFVLFCNTAGRERFFNDAALPAFHAALVDHAQGVRGDAPRVSGRAALPTPTAPPPLMRQPSLPLPPGLAQPVRRITQTWNRAAVRPPALATLRPGGGRPLAGAAARVLGARPAVLRLARAAPPLAHDPASFVYTDGSYTPANGTRPARRGCGVYDPSNPDPLRRRVCFSYSSGGILRGELLAIHWMLCNAAPASSSPLLASPVLKCLTDCTSALDLINAALYTPLVVANHDQAALLADIARAIAARGPACPVHLYHVRAHVGIDGNEQADGLADHAARHGTNLPPSPPPPAHGNGAAGGADPPAGQQPPPTDDPPLPTDGPTVLQLDESGPLAPPPPRPTRKSVLARIGAHAVANATTSTGKRLARVASALDPPALRATASPQKAYRSLTRPERDVAQQLRFNALPCRVTRPHAYPPGLPTCLHCGAGIDHVRHAFGRCTHAALKKLQTLYHHKAVELICNTVTSHGKLRARLLCNTAGPRSHNTVPGHLALPGAPPYPKRPDILQIQGWAGAAARVPAGRPAVRLLWVEFCFSDDAYLWEARQLKADKYTPDLPAPEGKRHLLDEARACGFQAWGVALHDPAAGVALDGRQIPVIAVGHSGVVTSGTLLILAALGLDKPAADRLAAQLSLLAAKRAHAIWSARLALDAARAGGRSPAVPAPSRPPSPPPPARGGDGSAARAAAGAAGGTDDGRPSHDARKRGRSPTRPAGTGRRPVAGGPSSALGDDGAGPAFLSAPDTSRPALVSVRVLLPIRRARTASPPPRRSVRPRPGRATSPAPPLPRRSERQRFHSKRSQPSSDMTPPPAACRARLAPLLSHLLPHTGTALLLPSPHPPPPGAHRKRPCPSDFSPPPSPRRARLDRPRAFLDHG